MDLWPLGPEQLIIIDPELASRYISARNLPKHQLQAVFLDPILGEGNIITVNGPRWKRLHNMLAPAFSTSRVSGMTRLIADDVKIFYSVLSDLSNTGKPFRLEDKIAALVFDIIYKTIYDASANAQIQGSDDLRQLDTIIRSEIMSRETWNPMKKRGLIQERKNATKNLNRNVSEMIQSRFRLLQQSDTDKDEKRGHGILESILRERIQSAKEALKSAELDPDFMEMVIANIKALMLAGSGTTTDTLCFAYMLLSVHPEVVDKLREEHRNVYSGSIDETLSILRTDPRRLNKLEYTNNVLKETLRIFPIGDTGRGPGDLTALTYNGKEYPTFKHTIICPVQYAWHMDPKAFPNPDAFDPDRFSNMDRPTELAWRPFERGTRQCLGQFLAMEEMKVVLLMTVQYFDFKCYGLKPNTKPRVPWTKLDLVFGDRAFQEFLTEARPRDGMMMTVTRLRKD